MRKICRRGRIEGLIGQSSGKDEAKGHEAYCSPQFFLFFIFSKISTGWTGVRKRGLVWTKAAMLEPETNSGDGVSC